MQPKQLALCISLAFLLPTSASKSPPSAAPPASDLDPPRLWAKLDQLRRLRDYPAIIQYVDEAARRIPLAHSRNQLARLLNVKAGAQFSLFRYQEALSSYRESKRLAAADGDWRLLSIVNSNLSALYLQQNELNAALHAAREAVACLERSGEHKSSVQIRVQAAAAEARAGDLASAGALLRQAAQQAEAGGDWQGAALAWDQWGYELLRSGNLDAAEQALLEAYRRRILTRSDAVASSYYTLGLLRLAQGDAHGSVRLLDKAAAVMSASGLALPRWRLHFERGRALRSAGQYVAAQSEFERALDGLAKLRLNWLPAESFWNASSVEQHGVYREYIQNCIHLYEHTRRERPLADSFAAFAEAQAAGLRTLLDTPGEWLARLPEEYWRTLAELRGLETEAGPDGPQARKAKQDELEYRLTEMELAAGLRPQGATWRRISGPEFVRQVRGALDSGSALIAFQLGEQESYRWAVTTDVFEFHKLAPAEAILPLAKALRDAVRRESPEAERYGRALYDKLFSRLSNGVWEKHRWILALDDELFLTPFAALNTGPRDSRRYLVETHALQLIPTPALLLDERRRPCSGPFVALADPIYNLADPRANHLVAASGYGLGGRVLPAWFRTTASKPPNGLARLPASAIEAENCARAWSSSGKGVIQLHGADATVANLRRALADEPAVVHIAAHFVAPAAAPARPLLALTLTQGGEPEWLSPVEISRWRYRIGTVVLSGCSSAAGDVLPGEGLMGMTRSWLAAGARSVIASLWPVPDGSGELFQAFYRHLAAAPHASTGGAAEALQKAQLEMIQSNTWRGRPAHWAAYVLVGTE